MLALTRGVLVARQLAQLPTRELAQPRGGVLGARAMAVQVLSGGKAKHQERQEALGRLGKDLARRARSKCELCTGAGAKLFETNPDAREPSLEEVLLLCERCTELVRRDCKGSDERELRFLSEVVWAETPVVADTAKSLLRTLGKNGTPWAEEALEMLGE